MSMLFLYERLEIPKRFFKNEAGSTAPPFHVNCRSTTAPYFDDMNGLGERFARDADGKTYTVPKDMTYSEWKNTYVDNSNNDGIMEETDRKNSLKYVGKEIIETDNRHVREWYVANVSDIPNQIDTSKSTEEQARQAFELRNKYKSEARAAMSDEETATHLNNKYSAKSFDDLVNDKMSRKGLTKEEAIADILKTSSTTNKDVNKIFGL